MDKTQRDNFASGQMLLVAHATELAVGSLAREALGADGQVPSSVLEHLPLQIALLRGTDLTVLRVSRAYRALFPGRDPVGKTLEHVWLEAAPLLTEQYRRDACHRRRIRLFGISADPASGRVAGRNCRF